MNEHEDPGAEGFDQGDEVGWPVKGPATPQQALFAIALIFVLGLLLGFVLGKTF